MKKILLLLVFSIVCLTFATPSLAGEVPTEKDNQKAPKQDQQLTEKAIKNTVNMLDQMELDMNNKTVENFKKPTDVSAMATSYLDIGSNATYKAANAGNCGYSGSGVGTHGEAYSLLNPYWCDSGTYLATTGDIGSWAWVGNQVKINGTGSRTAKISFNGSYAGEIDYYGTSSAGGRVRVSILDLDTGTDIGGAYILNTTDQGSYGGSFSKTVSVTLQGGHTYALRMGVSAASSVTSWSLWCQSTSKFCDTDNWGGWSPLSGGYGIIYNSIGVTWN